MSNVEQQTGSSLTFAIWTVPFILIFWLRTLLAQPKLDAFHIGGSVGAIVIDSLIVIAAFWITNSTSYKTAGRIVYLLILSAIAYYRFAAK